MIPARVLIQSMYIVLLPQSKAVAKTGGLQYQWQIMQSLGIKEEDIPKFADPKHWLQYFPPRAVQDLRSMGLKVEYRTS